MHTRCVTLGKKLLFMGSEFGQFLEWKYNQGLEWDSLNDDLNHKMQHYSKSLNDFYKGHSPLWKIDHDYSGIEIIDADNSDQSIFSFLRKDEENYILCVFNMTQLSALISLLEFPMLVFILKSSTQNLKNLVEILIN